MVLLWFWMGVVAVLFAALAWLWVIAGRQKVETCGLLVTGAVVVLWPLGLALLVVGLLFAWLVDADDAGATK